MNLPKLAAAALVVTAACTSQSAFANPGISGYSGKPYNGVSETCKTNCHGGGGAVPTLNITVPAAMKAGEKADVTIVVNGTRNRTSMNAALSDGVTATGGQNTTIPFPVATPGEVAAVTPPPNGQNGTYRFSFTAPNKNGPITLWIAGMSASGAGQGGDGVAVTTRTITVSGATTPPDPDVPPPEDAGASSSGGTADGGTRTGDGGTKPRDAGGDDDDDDSSSGGSSGRRLVPADDEGGCAAAGRTSPADASAIAIAAVGAIAIVAKRRRRR